jgi:predicted lipoprotein with Yx(FWY)xxD motif
VVPDKRTITAACGLLAAAALAMAACAPSGYGEGDQSSDSAAAPALANATGSPEASEAPAVKDKAPAAQDTGNNAEANLTTELKANSIKQMGKVVVNQDGFTLYLFTKDSKDPSKSNCNDTCAKIWPPALTDGNPTIDGISADLVGSVSREDGTKQVTIGGWPVYTYAGDKKPGAWKGQFVSGTWYVIDPTGKKNLTCLPTFTPKPVPPPADDAGAEDAAAEDSGSSDSGGGYSY